MHHTFSYCFHDFHQLSHGNDLNPKSEDGTKMVTMMGTEPTVATAMFNPCLKFDSSSDEFHACEQLK